MRVMFMTALYLPHMGGLEVLAGELLAEFEARGHDVALLTSKGERDLAEHETVDGIPVRRVDSHTVFQAA